MTAIAWPAVLAWRIRRQSLAERAPRARTLDVIARIAGLHAQLMGSAELTLWARVKGIRREAVAAALWEDRTLVKTWAQRGTLHLLPAAELPLWVAAQSALKPRHHVPSWLRHHGLTREQADTLLAAIPAALDGRELTREQLAAEVERISGVAGVGDRLRSGFGELLKPAAFRGDLCFAPSEGRNVRFARPDQWLGAWEPADPDAAALEVTRRYLSSYGPASREALARWFGITSPAVAGRWLKALGDEAAVVEVDGEPLTALAADVESLAVAEPEGAVRLLPAFDQYTVAAPRDRDAVVAADHRARVYRPQAWLSPVLLAGDRMAGVWRHEHRGGTVTVEIERFGRVSRADRAAAAAEAESLAAFLGGTLELRWA